MNLSVKSALPIFFLSLSITAFCQKDTITYGVPKYDSAVFKQANWSESESLYLMNKIIPYDSFYNFATAMMLNDTSFFKYFKSSTPSVPKPIYITDCEIVDGKGLLEQFAQNTDERFYEYITGSDSRRVYLEGGLAISKCSAQQEILLNSISVPHAPDNEIDLFENNLTSIKLDSIETPVLSIAKGKFTLLSVSNSDVGNFWLDSTSASNHPGISEMLNKILMVLKVSIDSMDFSNTQFINFENSKLKSVSLSNQVGKHMSVDFSNCKLEGDFNYVDTIVGGGENLYDITSSIAGMLYTKKRNDKWLKLEFLDSKINCRFDINWMVSSTNLNYIFENCEFGENTDFRNLRFDTLVIRDCYKISTPIQLLIPDSGVVYLSIINSDLKNISFDYNSHVKLIHDIDGNGNDELINRSYISLLEKFKSEGKSFSYQNLDVEYKQWRYSKRGALGWIADKINRYWWYYSYRKGYIVYWTIFFILLFTILNYRLWKKFSEAYPVSGKDKELYYGKYNDPLRHFRKGLHVFIITTFIFFSFKIDFDKLNFKKSSMLLYFFLQFVLGLICLFFIVNYLLKI